MQTRQLISLRQRNVAYVDQGQGSPLLLVHGFPLDLTMWQHQIAFFQQRCRVIAVDLPGFGASDSIVEGGDQSLGMTALADWLAEFLVAIDCGQLVDFCGLSMGGYVGWQFWRRHADRLRSLVACNTRAANDTEIVRRGREIAAKQVWVTGTQPTADAMVKKLFDSSRLDLADATYTGQTHRVISETRPQSVAAGQRGMAARENAEPWLSQIAVPMLFVAGQHDQITPAAEMKANADAVPQASYSQIPAAGHLSPLENPAAFNAALANFLQAFED